MQLLSLLFLAPLAAAFAPPAPATAPASSLSAEAMSRAVPFLTAPKE
ncbi:hypothetical protein TeGR_g4006, partial [Tetraparma gracilis]